ncbi:MAG TPA: glycosyltransferase family 1 protein [Planctomycetota bacterium]|nr:glycosyltransferase family 1 protein [Planctomycetota bacterium]
MRIALDISSAAREQSTGVAMYIRRMIAAFGRTGQGHEFTLVTRASRLKNLFHIPAAPAVNFSTKIMIERLHPIFARSIDVFHGLDSRLPGTWMKARTVVTIHDVFSALQSTEFADAEFREMKRKRYLDLTERADRIICVSESVKRDVQQTLNPDPAKLLVVYEAGGEGFSRRAPDEINHTRQKHGLARPYLIFVGSVNKRKNVPAMIRAFAAASKATGELDFAIAGRIGFGGEQIREAISQSGVADRVKLLGYVPDEDVPALYSGAEALLFTTLYEGFGIPALEAMACGCPVIGANVGSLPEIIGDAGVLADPASIDSIASAIETLLTDSSRRAALRERGFERARQFSWDSAAEKCLSIYQELLQSS